jgi:hypothetical protein
VPNNKLAPESVEPQPQIAFPISEEPAPSPQISVHVNFGVFTGREATLAEIDRLAATLLDRVEHVAIVSEVRHEIDRHSEAAVHQVRVEVPRAGALAERDELLRWLLDETERWAQRCSAERSAQTIRA